MNSLTIVFVAMMCLALDCVPALPLQKDIQTGEEIIFPTTTATTAAAAASASSSSTTSSTATTTETILSSTVVETTVSPVSELLNAIFRQTIYTRIESLLLDPGKRSDEKQKIVDSAVDNYHRQKMFGSVVDDTENVENVTKDENDISKSTGQSLKCAIIICTGKLTTFLHSHVFFKEFDYFCLGIE
jgi:hypothetical protein